MTFTAITEVWLLDALSWTHHQWKYLGSQGVRVRVSFLPTSESYFIKEKVIVTSFFVNWNDRRWEQFIQHFAESRFSHLMNNNISSTGENWYMGMRWYTQTHNHSNDICKITMQRSRYDCHYASKVNNTTAVCGLVYYTIVQKCTTATAIPPFLFWAVRHQATQTRRVMALNLTWQVTYQRS